MTATLRCNCDTRGTDEDSRDNPPGRVIPGGMLRTQLRRALLLQLRSEPELAALELGAMGEADVARAIRVLSSATAATWSELERRATYPIPLDHVVGRLHAAGGRDFDVSLDILQRAVLTNASVRLPVKDLIHAHGPGRALYGAFDATAAMIRFAGQRWWRPTADILIDLGFGYQHSNR